MELCWGLSLCDSLPRSVCGFLLLLCISVSLYSVFFCVLFLDTSRQSLCYELITLQTLFLRESRVFHTCLISNHGAMWECEESVGQLCSTRGWSRSDAAGALPGSVHRSTGCVSSGCIPADPYPAPVPEHNTGHRCQLYGSSGPVLSPHSPA